MPSDRWFCPPKCTLQQKSPLAFLDLSIISPIQMLKFKNILLNNQSRCLFSSNWRISRSNWHHIFTILFVYSFPSTHLTFIPSRANQGYKPVFVTPLCHFPDLKSTLHRLLYYLANQIQKSSHPFLHLRCHFETVWLHLIMSPKLNTFMMLYSPFMTHCEKFL